MNIPEIYREVEIRKCSLTGGEDSGEHLLVLGAVCPGSSKAIFILFILERRVT